MREIKFKVWSNKKMSTSTIDLSNAYCFTGNDANVFMQYTGLKDKNGIEIYEGDIWESSSHTKRNISTGATIKNPSWGRGTIDFIDGAFKKTLRIQENSWFGELPVNCPIFIKDGIASHLEIIGNIYQNPELIPK